MLGAWCRLTVASLPGRIATVVVFTALFMFGLVGAIKLEKDFKIEWFFPDDSYVTEFFELNDEYFSPGNTFRMYYNEVDVFREQARMNEVNAYLNFQDFIISGSVQDWWQDFQSDATPSQVEAQFWPQLRQWFQTGGAKRQRDVQWTDPRCNDPLSSLCDPSRGISHSRISARMAIQESGKRRYETYHTLREDLKDIFQDDTGMKVIPYTRSFMFWEEMGIIDVELARNLIIACSIIVLIIAVLIPVPRIGAAVALNIIASIVEVVGLAHWWGVTMNGIATIYFLICIGLAVDYSTHIAHAFRDSYGSSQERAIQAVDRIGASVFHAIFSTLLAVSVLSVSKSFVFEIFFKVLLLVTFVAGAHGIWLLPLVLALVGGSATKGGGTGKGAAKPTVASEED